LLPVLAVLEAYWTRPGDLLDLVRRVDQLLGLALPDVGLNGDLPHGVLHRDGVHRQDETLNDAWAFALARLLAFGTPFGS